MTAGNRRRIERSARSRGGISQQPFRPVRRRYQPIEVISADEVERIHQTALAILREIGLKVLDAGARQRYRQAGASVDAVDERVRFEPELVMQLVSQAPPQFTLRARNPEKSLEIGGDKVVFTSVGGPAFAMDRDRGRRPGSYADQCDYLKLIQSLDILHQEGGGPLEAMDLDPATRHLDLTYAEITLLDKSWQPQTLWKERALDAIDMAAISIGVGRDDMRSIPMLAGVINTNSPLQLDVPMAEGLITLAEYGQVNIVTPFTLAGAMAPVTLAGALAQQHAEAMAGIALAQIVRPGVPVMYGGFTSNVDMRTGAPAFGTPEYALAAQASGQLARRLAIPFRSSNVTAANTVDVQAAYESQMALWGSIMGGAHMIEHAAGWLGGGLTASFEKLIVDAEMLQMMTGYLDGFEVNEDALALDAVREVGPGGHFFGAKHTIARYENAFYKPLLSNWQNYDAFLEGGAVDGYQRANEIWKQLLAEYEQPPIDAAIDEALRDFVARRKREGGAPTN